MTERELAENICRVHARTLVDENEGYTMGGETLSNAYAEKFYKAGGYDVTEIAKCQKALRHWVLSAGYGKGGKFQTILSNTILNC